MTRLYILEIVAFYGHFNKCMYRMNLSWFYIYIARTQYEVWLHMYLKRSSNKKINSVKLIAQNNCIWNKRVRVYGSWLSNPYRKTTDCNQWSLLTRATPSIGSPLTIYRVTKRGIYPHKHVANVGLEYMDVYTLALYSQFFCSPVECYNKRRRKIKTCPMTF